MDEKLKGTEPMTNSFKLTFDTSALSSVFSGGNHTSGYIKHDAVASIADSNADGTSMEEILEAMPNIGDVSVHSICCGQPQQVVTHGLLHSFLIRDSVV